MPAKAGAVNGMTFAWALSLVAALSLAGCASPSASDASYGNPGNPANSAAARLALDRERLQAEADAAVAIAGRRVCRQQRLGLAERQTERGVVVRDAQGQWRVRTEAGTEVPALGAGWTPCV
jgi:hypothetical protein